jgi:hypothetical protein
MSIPHPFYLIVSMHPHSTFPASQGMPIVDKHLGRALSSGGERGYNRHRDDRPSTHHNGPSQFKKKSRLASIAQSFITEANNVEAEKQTLQQALDKSEDQLRLLKDQVQNRIQELEAHANRYKHERDELRLQVQELQVTLNQYRLRGDLSPRTSAVTDDSVRGRSVIKTQKRRRDERSSSSDVIGLAGILSSSRDTTPPRSMSGSTRNESDSSGIGLKGKKSTGLRQPGPEHSDEEHARYAFTFPEDYLRRNPGHKINADGTISMPHLRGSRLVYETRPIDHPYLRASRTKNLWLQRCVQLAGVPRGYSIALQSLGVRPESNFKPRRLETQNIENITILDVANHWVKCGVPEARGNEVLEWARRYAEKKAEDSPNDGWGDILRACYVPGAPLPGPLPGALLVYPRTGRLEDTAPLITQSPTLDSLPESVTSEHPAESGLKDSHISKALKAGGDEIMADVSSAPQTSRSTPVLPESSDDTLKPSQDSSTTDDVPMSDIDGHNDELWTALIRDITKDDQTHS